MIPKIQKLIGKEAPLTNQLFFGPKFLVPQYRQPDYCNLDFQNYMDFERCMSFASGKLDRRDQVAYCVLSTTIAAFDYKRPTLFLERELAEALLRTESLGI
ncbi:MAG: hypothetical protein JO076_00440 [Verrucomicrobia bacterium]|nr:hypothetical protein [Verrucomicrobiota bacterium]